MAFPTGWLRRQKLTIDYTKVAANLTDFPVLLTEGCFQSSIFSFTDNGGGDLRFSSDEAGTTQLSCEVVNFNTATSKCEIYVKIPTLSHTANTIFYVWYSNTGQVQPAINAAFGAESVWDANFKGVWHMSGANAAAAGLDSTSNSLDCTTADGSPTFALNGKWSVGGCVDFNNNSDIYKAAYNLAASACTFLAWIYLDTDAGTDGVFAMARGESGGFALYPNGSNTAYWSLNTTYSPSISDSPGAGSWFSITGTHDGVDGAGGLAQMYLNGAYKSQQNGDRPEADASCDVVIGALGRSANYLDGKVEEIRWSNIDRGANFILTEQNNLNAPTTFTAGSNLSIFITLSDTITLSEFLILIRTTTKTWSEIITLSEAFGKAISRTFTEIALTISDTISQQKGKSLADIITITDLGIGRAITKVLSEISSITDSISKAITRIFTETAITISDSYSSTRAKIFDEIITITENFTKNFLKVFTEIAITLSDTFVKLTSKNFFDTINIKEWLWYQYKRTASLFSKLTAGSGIWTKQTPNSKTWTKDSPDSGIWTKENPHPKDWER